jgi:hypothetical protein
VSECDREASIMRRPWPTKGCYVRGNLIQTFYNNNHVDLSQTAVQRHKFRASLKNIFIIIIINDQVILLPVSAGNVQYFTVYRKPKVSKFVWAVKCYKNNPHDL